MTDVILRNNLIDTSTSVWKKLIEINAFDDCYPQRINASFQYLTEQHGDFERHRRTFSLKDLIQKAYFIFTYLSINVDKDSNFAIMDIFRSFDRSGRGEINLDEFVIGVIEKLRLLSLNNSLLEEICDELISIEPKSIELLNKLENYAKHFAKARRFTANFRALLLPVKARVKANQHKLEGLDMRMSRPFLSSCLDEALQQAIRDSQQFFHIAPQRLIGSTVFVEEDNMFSETTQLADEQPPMAWNPVVACGRAQQWGTEEALHLLHESNGDVTALEEIISDGLRSDQCSKLVSSSLQSPADALSNALFSPLMKYAPSGSNEQSTLDALSGQSQPPALDASQLFLLQTMYRSVDSLLSVAAADPSGASVIRKHADALPTLLQLDYRDKIATREERLLTLVQRFSLEKENLLIGGAATVGSSDAHDLMGESLSVVDQARMHSQAALNMELLQRLLETQEELRKTQLRMDVMALVHNQALQSEEYNQGSNVSVDGSQDRAESQDAREVLTALGSERLEDTTTPSIELRSQQSFKQFMQNAISGRDNTNGSEWTEPDSPISPSDDTISFSDVLTELSALKASLAERASVDHAFGYFTDNRIAVLPLNKADADGTADASDALSDNVLVLMRELASVSEHVLQQLSAQQSSDSGNSNLLQTLQQHEERFSELRTSMEHCEVERAEFVSIAVELQVLREKNARLLKEEEKNRVLQRTIAELNVQLNAARMQFEDYTASKSAESDHARENKHAAGLTETMQELEAKTNELQSENERLVKENQRLKSSNKVSEQRVKGALQDHMTLHQQLQRLEEELAVDKATITKLTRDLEDMRVSRSFKQEAERRLEELQAELHRRDLLLSEERESASLSNKYQLELQRAEKTIEALENTLSEYSIELEKGSVALNELDNYRDQLRQRTKDSRDMMLRIHTLESQLKEVPYLQKRFNELSEELQEFKLKAEKIPGLMAEIGRLRGSSRASVKALVEQDKLLTQLKAKVTQLEKEAVVLRNESRGLREVEQKLGEANEEIEQLLTSVSDMNTLKAGVRTAEEEKRQMEGQYKKMRKFMRQSVVSSNNIGSLMSSAAPKGHGSSSKDHFDHGHASDA